MFWRVHSVGVDSQKKSSLERQVIVASFLIDRVSVLVYLWRKWGWLCALIPLCGLLTALLTVRALCGLICGLWVLKGTRTDEGYTVDAHLIKPSPVVLVRLNMEADAHLVIHLQVELLNPVFAKDAHHRIGWVGLVGEPVVSHHVLLRHPLVACCLTDTAHGWHHRRNFYF